ncbi:MAG: hypothetical protein Q9208_005220 [Pyrenodesmia sp. 3 TL-2023]
MVSKASVALKGVSTFLRVLELLGSLLILGICSYWMGVLSNRNSSIPTWMKAVEGISGGAVIYTAFAVILTFFLGGKAFFAFLGLLLDILFCPSNNYTSGSGKKPPFWKRKGGAKTTHGAYADGVGTNGSSTANTKQPFWKRNKKPTHDAELGASGAGALITEEKHRHNDNRTSHETGVTGTTAGSPGATYGGPTNKYAHEPTAPHNTHHNGGVGTNAPTNNGYQPYSQSGMPTQPHKEVIHDPEPYTEIHHGGYPHSATRTEYPNTFGHGNYNAT